MTDLREHIGRKKESAILALLTSRSVEDAARNANVPARTLYRWMKEPAFSAAYRQAQRATLEQAIGRLQQGAGAAAAMILKLMVDPTVPASTRLRAAESALTHAANGIELEEIGARIAALEKSAEEMSQTE